MPISQELKADISRLREIKAGPYARFCGDCYESSWGVCNHRQHMGHCSNCPAAKNKTEKCDCAATLPIDPAVHRAYNS